MSGSANQGSATAPPANTPLSREVLDEDFARHVWYEQQIDVRHDVNDGSGLLGEDLR